MSRAKLVSVIRVLQRPFCMPDCSCIIPLFVVFGGNSGLAGQLAWTYVGEQFTDAQNTLIPDATGRTGKIPAYQMVDVNLRYKLRGTGLTFKLAAKDALNQTYIFARRPDGIQVGGFSQILAGVRWDWDEKKEDAPVP